MTSAPRIFATLTLCCLAAALFAGVPRPAPKLTVPLPGGKTLDIERFKGKVIALEFLKTTCPHCRNTSTTMQKLLGELGPQGFQPIGVAIDPKANELVPHYVKQLGLTFPVGIGHRDIANTYREHPKMFGMTMPQLVFIDKKGVIRFQYGGGDGFIRWNEEENIRRTVKKLLAE